MSETTLRLQAGDPARDGLVVGRVVLVLGEEAVTLELGVPPGPVAFQDIVPILQGLADFVVGRGVAAAETAGRTVSCRAGCGACCRQLVPVSQAEARALADLVAAMPATRQDEIRRRFDAALQALQAGGVLREIDAARENVGGGGKDGDDTRGTITELGMRYFRQGVACPFLEDEACSIHPDRPLSCRQYLVTSPAAGCATPSRETIDLVVLPARPSQALLLADGEDAGASWLPLVYALAYASEVPAPARVRTAADILGDVFTRLSKPAGLRE